MPVKDKTPAKPRARTTGLKLDLGAGNRPTEGFKSVDITGDPDYLVDLFQFPWPFADRSVREVVCNHMIEHIPHYRPEYGGIDGWWLFFNELYRVMQKNGKATFTFPYAKSDRAFWDPSHTRYIHEMHFNYLSPDWLREQQLDQYPVTCNFRADITGTGVPDAIMNRNQEMQDHARNHYWNFFQDLHVVLTAIK